MWRVFLGLMRGVEPTPLGIFGLIPSLYLYFVRYITEMMINQNFRCWKENWDLFSNEYTEKEVLKTSLITKRSEFRRGQDEARAELL